MRILLMAALMAVFSWPVLAATWSPGDSLYVRHACFSESAALEIAASVAGGADAIHAKIDEFIARRKCAHNQWPSPPVAVVLQELVYEIIVDPPGEVWKAVADITFDGVVYETVWVILDLKAGSESEGV